MTKATPNYLKLHHAATSSPLPMDTTQESVKGFWQAYSDATGWRIDVPNHGSMQQPELTEQVDAGHSAGIDRVNAEKLAQSAASLTQELEQAHQVVREQAAELSARAALVGQGDRNSLAESINQILERAVAATGTDAAVMYMLDDDTQFLSVRAVHGLPLTRLSQPPRVLRGSRGDLEAMVRNVVSISDLSGQAGETWACPEDAASAMCAAILQDDVPIGTLWVFSRETASFDSSREAAMQLATSHIATKLQKAGSRTAQQKQSHSDIQNLAQWQYASLPTGQVLAPGWRVDGMIDSPKQWATGWHHWDVLPDGTLMLAIAEADDDTVSGAMTATVARAALTAHSGYRHTPKQMLQRISDTLWQTNTMDQLTSLLYARIDPETGEGEVCVAGEIQTLIASRYGYRPIIQSTHMPLASNFDVETNQSTFRMMPGEVLMSHTNGMTDKRFSQTMIGNLLRGSMQEMDSCPLASVRRAMADKMPIAERGAVTLLRQS